MPRLRANGAELHYEERGRGPETIVSAHGPLWSGCMIEPQVRAPGDRCRGIAFDFRGQGESEVTGDGDAMETLAEDAAALVEALGAAPCHLVGPSMGATLGSGEWFETLELKTNYPKAVRQGRLAAEARAVKRGRSVWLVEATSGTSRRIWRRGRAAPV